VTIPNPVEDPDFDLLNELTSGKLRYAVWQLERAPSTGLVHFQVYVEWSSPQRASVFEKWTSLPPTSLSRDDFSEDERFAWCGGFHAEPRIASREAARQYCMEAVFKGEDKGRLDGPWEWGDFDDGGSGKRNDLRTVASFVAKGGTIRDVAEKWPDTFVRYERGLRSLQEILAPSEFREVEGWVIWGDTGVGKSHWVYTTFGASNVYTLANESPLWFDGYAGQPVLFLEEFNSDVPIKKLLQIVDGYPFLAPIKGGFVSARWTRVIVTSNSDIAQQWPPELKRRFGFGAGRSPLGNVRHCRFVGGERTGFPSPDEVGGGYFPIVRRPHRSLVSDAGAGGAQLPADVPVIAPPPVREPPAGEAILPSFVQVPSGLVVCVCGVCETCELLAA